MPKIGLLLCLLLASVSHAELPYIPDDNKAQWNDEYLDGKVDSVKADVNALSGGSTAGVVDIAHGGTAGATAAQARTNLGVPSNTGTGASGTWPINITGSAATATDSSKVAKTGDTMTGQLTMSGSSIAFVNGGSIEQANYVSADAFYGPELNKNAGLFDFPSISSNAVNSVIIGTSTFAIYDNANYDGHLYVRSITAPQVVSVVTGNNIIYVEWNGGSPRYASATGDTGLDWSNMVPVADIRIRSDGTIKYQLPYGAAGEGGTERNIHRVFMLRRFERESGLVLSAATGRVVNITSGVGWFGNNYATANAFTSASDPMYYYMHNGAGAWIEASTGSYLNEYYDTPTGTMTLTANRYAVNWIYRNVSGTQEVDIVLGTGNYTLAQAQASQPQTPPPGVAWFYYPVGRIIIQKGASTPTSVENFVSGDALSYSAVSSHQDLLDIQGGTAGQYYHTTAAELANVQTIPAIVLSTGSIYSALNSTASALTAEIARATARENAIGYSTGTINADLQAYKTTVQLSTASIYSALNSTAAALTAEIARATARENAIAISTGVIFDTISTAAYLSSSQTFTGSNAFNNLLVTRGGVRLTGNEIAYSGFDILQDGVGVRYTIADEDKIEFVGDNQSLIIGPDKITIQSGNLGLNILNSDIILSTTASSFGIQFQDGTRQTTAALGSEWLLNGTKLYTNRTDVGINTTNPTAGYLDVNGNIKATPYIKVTNTDTYLYGDNDINGHKLGIVAGSGSNSYIGFGSDGAEAGNNYTGKFYTNSGSMEMNGHLYAAEYIKTLSSVTANDFFGRFNGNGANITGITGAQIPNFRASTDTLAGDVTGTYGATVVGNDSHLHGLSTLTGIRASTDTLAGDVTGTYGATVVGDNSHLHAMSSLQGVLSSTTSIATTLVNLSTVTTALAGKLSNTTTVPANLVNLSTVTTALATKVPYTGATGSVSLGSYGLTASSFTTSGNVTAYAVNASSVVSSPQICLGGDCQTAWPEGGGGGGSIYDGGPIGSIITYSTTTPPAGYLYCDGSAVSRTTYAELFAVSSCTYGCANGTTFNLPDMRGMFMRGAFGNLNSRDPDANRVVGSTQTDTMQGHYHRWYPSNYTGFRGDAIQRTADELNIAPAGATYDNRVREAISDGTNGSPRTSVETRPENIAVAYMIKYANPIVVDVSTFTLSSTTNTFTGGNTFTGPITSSGNNNWTGANTFSQGVVLPDGTTQSTRGGAFIGARQISVDASAADSGGYTVATKFWAYESFTATKMALNFHTNTAGTTCKYAIYANYSDNSRPDGAPLATTSAVTLSGVTDILAEASLVSPYKIESGRYYWLAFNCSANMAPFQLTVSNRVGIGQYWADAHADGFMTITTQGTADHGQILCAYP